MPLLKYLLSNHLIKVDSSLMKINEIESAKMPGLYDENNNLVKTWDQLIEEGLVTVEWVY